MVAAKRQHFVDQELEREVAGWLLQIGLNLVLEADLGFVIIRTDVHAIIVLHLLSLNVDSFD